ncbi:hypothetical protein N9J17_01410, partial [Aquiluna sp.]
MHISRKLSGLRAIAAATAVLLTLSGCSAEQSESRSMDSSPSTAKSPSSTEGSGEAVVFESGYLPGVYLPEHCEFVEPDAVPVFEDL